MGGGAWAEGNGLEAIVLRDPAGFPDDVGDEVGVLQLLVLCPLNQPGAGAGGLRLLGHIRPGATYSPRFQRLLWLGSPR